MLSPRTKTLLVAVLALATVAAATTAVPTASAWTDETLTQADAAAGSWTASTPPDPFEPGDGTTEIPTVGWDIAGSSTAGFCAELEVTTASPAPVSWSVRIDLDAAPFWGADASTLWVEGGAGPITAATGGGAIVSGSGAISAGAPIRVRICTGAGRKPPVGDPSWYHVASSISGTWTRTEACVDTTVTGSIDPTVYPYYYGWAASVDLSAAITAIRAAGGTPTHVSWTPDGGGGYQYDVTPRPTSAYANTIVADDFDVTSGIGAAIRGRETFTLTACVNAY